MVLIRVLVVDDHTVVRAGIRTILEQMPNVKVIGEATNGREALQFLRTHSAEVDVVMLDVSMAELDGLATTGYITNDYPNIRVLILSMHTTETYVLPAMRTGPGGYVPKSAPPPETEPWSPDVARGGNLSESGDRPTCDRRLSPCARAKRSAPSQSHRAGVSSPPRTRVVAAHRGRLVHQRNCRSTPRHSESH